MFRRVITESWHDWAPYAGFAITFAVFVLAFVRAILMRHERVEQIARLPLDDEPEPRRDSENLSR